MFGGGPWSGHLQLQLFWYEEHRRRNLCAPQDQGQKYQHREKANVKDSSEMGSPTRLTLSVPLPACHLCFHEFCLVVFVWKYFAKSLAFHLLG